MFLIMKKIHILCAFAVMMTLSSCDFLRMLAGRPTSEEIEERRLEILRAEEAELRLVWIP